VGDEADPGGVKPRVVASAWNRLGKLGAELPGDDGDVDPNLSNTRPFMIDMTPPPPSGRSQALRSKRPGAMPAVWA